MNIDGRHSFWLRAFSWYSQEGSLRGAQIHKGPRVLLVFALVQLLRTMLSAHRVCWCSAWWVSVQPDTLLLPGVALWE